MKIVAVDAMGGDFAPAAIIDGVLLAAQQGFATRLFGPRSELENLLNSRSGNWQTLPISIEHAPHSIAMDADPVSAIRQYPQSSLVQAVKAVKQNDCSAVISAGNSGAVLAAATLLLGRQPNVLRPAIVGYIPTLKGHAIALDIGANTQCRPEHLLQFAIMGHQYSINNLGRENPRIGLLSNGHEPNKGSILTKEAFSLLKSEKQLNFVGNVEPPHVFKGEVDVVVCDGFTGNIFLKTMESAYGLFAGMLHQQGSHSASVQQWRDDFLSKIRKMADVSEQGGAVLLGVKGDVMVCHGNADAHTISKAIARSAGDLSSTVSKRDKRVFF